MMLMSTRFGNLSQRLFGNHSLVLSDNLFAKSRTHSDVEWVYGDLKKAEAEGRIVNGEYGLAMRGYGE